MKEGKYDLRTLGDTCASFQDCYLQATKFMLSCYGYTKCFSTTATRQKAWKTKDSNAICDVPLTYVLCLSQMRVFNNVTFR